MKIKNKNKKPFPYLSFGKRKKGTVYVIFVFLVLLVAGSCFVVVRQQRSQLETHFNQQVQGLTTASTNYLVNNYILYYSSPTIKYQQLIDTYLAQNSLLEKFQIVNAEGKILFDSKDYQNKTTTSGSIDNSYLDASRLSEPTYLYEGNKIETVISPYFEDWGAHKYTVIYKISFTEINSSVLKIKIAASAIGFLLIVVVVVLGGVFIASEQTRINRLEKKRMEVVDRQRREFLLLASHNLRTPLTKISGYVGMLNDDTKLNKEQLAIMTPINDAVNRLGEIIDNILTIVSVQETESKENSAIVKTKISLPNLVNEILEKNTDEIKAKTLSVNVDIQPNSLEITTKRDYLEKILTAIITNAIKFNNEKGEVGIKMFEENSKVKIQISDTGIGIKEENQKNVYTIFHQSSNSGKDIYVYNYDGVGVGLYMAKLLIEYLGGTIRFESVLDKGTTFYLDLPKSTTSGK